jgi:Peptidase family M28
MLSDLMSTKIPHTGRRFAVVTAAAVLLLTTSASLQKAPTPAPKKKDAGTITEASIRGHMEFLASDAMKGRGSGTEDEWRAATYIGSQMRRWGIEPLGDDGGYVQQIDSGRMTVAAAPTLAAKDLKLTHGKEMLVQGNGLAVSAPLRRYNGDTVAQGSALLLPEGVAPDPNMNAAAVILMPETAAIRSNWDATGARMPAAAAQRAGGPPPVARIVLNWEAYGRIAAMADGTPINYRFDTKPGYTWNAIGQLKGTDAKLSNEVILLTAHLDHLGVRGTTGDTIFNGADDDASGSTAVLELCEALAKGPRPKRTVIFAWFGSEESGGAGARNFLTKPPVPLDHIAANLEFEMIANRDPKVPPHTLWLTGYERSNLGPELAKQGARIAADPHPEQGFFQRSDNIQLACRGVIAQTVSSYDALGATYHKANDDLSHVDFAHMTDSIQSMLKPVLWLANSNFKPDWIEGKKPGPGNGCGR